MKIYCSWAFWCPLTVSQGDLVCLWHCFCARPTLWMIWSPKVQGEVMEQLLWFSGCSSAHASSLQPCWNMDSFWWPLSTKKIHIRSRHVTFLSYLIWIYNQIFFSFQDSFHKKKLCKTSLDSERRPAFKLDMAMLALFPLSFAITVIAFISLS